MSNLTPTQVTDKNGKQTTVHKRLGAPEVSGRTQGLPSPLPQRKPTEQELRNTVRQMDERSYTKLCAEARSAEDGQETDLQIAALEIALERDSLRVSRHYGMKLREDLRNSYPEVARLNFSYVGGEYQLEYYQTTSGAVHDVSSQIGAGENADRDMDVEEIFSKYAEQVGVRASNDSILLIPLKDMPFPERMLLDD